MSDQQKDDPWAPKPSAPVIEDSWGVEAQTLGKRKAEQPLIAPAVAQPSKFLEGIKLMPGGKVVYDESYLNAKMRQELGFDLEYQYKDEAEEAEIAQAKDNFQISVMLTERYNICNQFKERMEMVLKLKENEYRQQLLLLQQSQNSKHQAQKKAPVSKMQTDENEHKQEDNSDDFSSSSSSSGSRSRSSYSGGSSSGSRSGSYSSSSSRQSQKKESSWGKDLQQPKAPVDTTDAWGVSRPIQQPNAWGVPIQIQQTNDWGIPSNIVKSDVWGVIRNPETGSIPNQHHHSDSSEDDNFETNGPKRQKTDLVANVTEILPVVLRRKQVEDLSQELLSFLKDTFVGCFVRVSSRGKYRLAEIIGLKNNLDAGESGVYQLGKNKTSLLVNLKYGDDEQWHKLTLLSNQLPTEDEFQRMKKAFKLAKDDNIKKTLNRTKIGEKTEQLAKLKKQGGPKYSKEEQEESVMEKLNWRIRTNQIQGLNLSYYKVELTSNISYLRDKLKEVNDQAERRDLENKLKEQLEHMVIVTKALRKKTEKGSMYIDTMGDNGKMEKVLVQELEKKIAAEEWTKEQEYSLRHPEYKKNNYFMKSVGAGGLALQREDSINDRQMKGEDLTEQEKAQLQIYQDIRDIQKRQADFDLDCIKDSSSQRFSKVKFEHEAFHKTFFKGYFDDGFEGNTILDDIKNRQDKRVTRPIIRQHPDSLDKRTTVQVPYGAKIVTFDEYFNQ